MSAICGIFHIDGRPVMQDRISRMSAALAHRGPDGAGTWTNDVAGLAHRMLRTTPESLAEVQPVTHAAAALTLVADARLDNREELLSTLRLSSPSTSDSEIILSSYLRWGDRCVERLIGDFAFAVWDARAQTLFCARDPMGVKPIYYVHAPRRFMAFASEAKALLELPEVDSSLDADQIALFLGWHHEERVRTMYKEVVRLPAGHMLVASREQVMVRRYWSLDSCPDVRFATDAEYADRFREIFSTAVQSRMRSIGPLGATLSGGLDSSSIVCVARELRGGQEPPLRTFSLIFPELPERDLRAIDERAFVAAVTSRGGVEPHFIRGDRLAPLHDVGRIVDQLDEPYSTPNLYLHAGLFRAAKSAGVRVLLDGFDGDSVVSHGYGRLTDLARAHNWEKLESEIGAFSAHIGRAPDIAVRRFVIPLLAEFARRGKWIAWLRTSSELARRFGIARRELAVGSGLRPLLSAPRRHLSGVLGECEAAVLRPWLADVLRRARRTTTRADARRALASERQDHMNGLSWPLYQLTLEIADKTAAACGIEPRYPFFDQRLIQFCVGLPASQKFADGWPRSILRRAMQGLLPPVIQWRSSKGDLSPNFHRRFALDLVEHDQPDDSVLSPYLDVARLREVASRYRSAPSDPHHRDIAMLLFRVATLETWLKQLSDRRHLRVGSGTSAAA